MYDTLDKSSVWLAVKPMHAGQQLSSEVSTCKSMLIVLVVCCHSSLQESDILRKLQTNRTSAQDANNAVINTGDNVVYNEAGAGSKGQLAVRKEKGGG